MQINPSFLKQLAPPASTSNSAEHYLAEKASARKITWLDLVISGGILSDLVLSLIIITTKWWYIGTIEVFLSLYLLVWLLARRIRPLLARLLLAGFIAGLCELFTDASGQYVAHSLIYPVGEVDTLDFTFIYATLLDGNTNSPRLHNLEATSTSGMAQSLAFKCHPRCNSNSSL